MSYSPQLNVRSAYNFQESLIKIEDYLDFCVANNFNFAFYTDKNVMYGAAEFSKLAQQKGIQPILGLTTEIETTTLIFIAKNQKGYQNLCYLSSWLINHDVTTLSETLEFIKPFLSENLILVADNKEIQPLIADVIKPNDQYLETIQTKRISYLHQSEEKTFRVIKALKENLKLVDLPPLPNEDYPTNEELANASQQATLLKEIANKVSFQLFEQKAKPHLIKFPTPQNISANTYLAKLTQEALMNLFLKQKIAVPKNYQERLDYELKVIQEMGFADYFLVVWDYVKFAIENKILVGPGRGSAGGSLVSYLLGITQIDPLEYDLLFERFLNPERETMPDIDIDFQDTRRDEVIAYLFNKYGQFHLATIVTYQTIGAKSAIRDVARVYDLDLETVNVISKNIGFYHQNDLKGAIEASDILKSYAQKYPDIFKSAQQLLGLPRQTGTHAAGLIFTEEDLRNYIPIKINYDGIAQTQFDMNYLEDLGLIKMDLLGLRNLSTLQTIQNNILRNNKPPVELQEIPLNDPQTFRLLQRGDTSGIFQLESPGMLKVVQSLGVNSIDDISAASALFRPGPQEMIPTFVKRKKQKNAINNFLIDPSLAPILDSTYGIIVYQEQVLQMLQKVGNFSLGKSDIVRRAMSKKVPSYMQEAKVDFLKGAQKNHYSAEQALKIWNWIEQFANYGFNKAHSIAYSYISYWLAYFKTHYPLEFYAALLSGVKGNEIKTAQYLQEVKNLGLKIQPPTIKKAQNDYNFTVNTLILPLSLIKGVGPEFIRRLNKEAARNPHLFDSLFHFLHGTINNGLTSNIFQALVWSGALDLFNYDRPTLSANEEVLFNFAKLSSALPELNPNLYPVLNKATKNAIERADLEKKYYGFFLGSHPLTTYRQKRSTPLLPLRNLETNGLHQIIVMVNNIRPSRTKNGHSMAFVTIGDETEQLVMTVFGEEWEKIQQQIQIKSIILITVKVGSYLGKKNIVLRGLDEVIKF
ncbi:DNA polymerase-3 subunit alpha [Entomoplasma freundtii]|uniref:DNA-directed DNA polymerase n=1 Tax=Entomoplasma freundtii TaxID=74700 RepID=A0A2K8NUL0_9MOLU|nr:DNA polymerase III subunit alpha [Entomoplasma freundtii]ATZ16451.1 DNA polymerase III subunit alpha [Entomoplasma freundtii]TDY55981.1 DNA polymerase-3 subunit alpha [Entomoplasma freundtii]